MTKPVDSTSFVAAKERWLKRVASYPKLTSADLAVAIWLSTYLNSKSRDAWPAMRRLAANTKRNLATVARSLRRLEKLNLLSVTHGRGRKKPNRYRPAFGDRANVRTDATEMYAPVQINVRTGADRTLEEPQNEPQNPYGRRSRKSDAGQLAILEKEWRKGTLDDRDDYETFVNLIKRVYTEGDRDDPSWQRARRLVDELGISDTDNYSVE